MSSPYREGGPVASLPFARAHLPVVGVLVVLASVMSVLLATFIFVGTSGSMRWREGGSGMYALALLSVVVACVVAVRGCRALRGERRAGALVSAVPGVMPVASAILYVHATGATFGVLEAYAPADARQTVRIALLGVSEASSLVVYGALLGGFGLMAAATALLGVGATIDRTRTSAPAGGSWILSLVFGAMGGSAALAQRVIDHASLSLWSVIPILGIFTVLSVFAARNGPAVRACNDPREAQHVASSLAAAGLLAVASVVLLDLAGWFVAHSAALETLSLEDIDRVTQARLLADSTTTLGKLTKLAWLDGAAVSMTVVPSIFASCGARRRLLFGTPAMSAFVGTLAMALTVGAAHSWTFASLRRVELAATAAFAMDLPVVEPRAANLVDQPAALTLSADGSRATDNGGTYRGTLGIAAERHLRWAVVVKAMRDAMMNRDCRYAVESLAIRVATRPRDPGSSLNRYDTFLGPEESAIRVVLDEVDGLRMNDGDDMDAVVTKILAAGPDAHLALSLRCGACEP